MAAKHPYISATGAISQVLTQLRKNFPSTIDADTLKKYSIAPNNESYLISALKFVGVIDEKGQRTDPAKTAFVLHDDSAFFDSFAKLVQDAYADLFALYGEDAWSLPKDKLISFFRQSDETSDVIGTRQASTFVALAQYVQKRIGSTTPLAKKVTSIKPGSTKQASVKSKEPEKVSSKKISEPATKENVGVAALTVRIEVNLPAGADQATYDAIFKSIRANLMQ